MFTAACLQLNTTNDIEKNVQDACLLIHKAAAQGADFITLPENCILMEENGVLLKQKAPLADNNLPLQQFQKTAKETGKWLLIGSIHVLVEGEEKLRNRSYLLAPTGNIATYYDKIHLFDSTPSEGEVYKESNRCAAGEKAVISPTPLATIGLTVCYDLRFPHLFRTLAKAGAEVITVPAAFTYTTGKVHWHVLLRARAIETGCYIIAPAQCGTHPGNRRTFGHSLIIDPWGTIIAEANEEVGIITAKIDITKVKETRKRIPSLEHDRNFDIFSPVSL